MCPTNHPPYAMASSGSNCVTELRHDSGLYQALFERANDAILIFEPITEVIFEANTKACELYGRSQHELVGMSLKQLTKEVESGERQIAQLLREGKYDLFETVHYNRKGEELHILANSSVIDYHGRRAILSINRDVSDLRRMQDALNAELEERVRRRTADLIEANAALEREMHERRRTEEQLRQAQKLEAIGRLAGGVAHDFNNILMLIIGYTTSLLGHTNPETPARGFAEQILRAGERATSLTRQLLAFGRKQVMAPKVLELNAVLTDFSKMLPRLLGEDIDLIFEPQAELARVKADPAQIELAVMNLALNARDAMPQGGTLTITTRNRSQTVTTFSRNGAVPPGEYVVISIGDTGHGMDPKTQSRIFEPFFSTKGASKGTGLGLASVHGIVTQSGGYITLQSELGKGTMFEIYLPAVLEDLATLQPDLPLRPACGTETILLVEDEPGIREMSRGFLENFGYTVLEARTGKEALIISEEFPDRIDLLITDVIMPGMRGNELAASLMSRRPDVKVLYVSGFADVAITPDAPILEKPFAFEILGMEIRRILDQPMTAFRKHR